MASTASRYAAPALDKGLDILEALAAQPGGLTQAEIAAALQRSVGEIFRMLETLLRRGDVTICSSCDAILYMAQELREDITTAQEKKRKKSSASVDS